MSTPFFKFFHFSFFGRSGGLSALLLKGCATLSTGNPNLPLSSGDPELDAAGGALEDLEMPLLLGLVLPALFAVAEAAGLLEELPILLLPLGNVAGQGAIDADPRSQHEGIIKNRLESPHRNKHGSRPADQAHP